MFQKYWQPAMIIDHIVSRAGTEKLHSHYYATTYPKVHAAAIRIWGSWKETIIACGLDYDKVCKYQHWSKSRIISEIRALRDKGEPVNSQVIQKKHKPLYMASIKRYGSWGEAIRHAGINYRRVRIRRRQTNEEIREQILELYHQGVSLSYPNMRKNHQYLLAAGMKKLGDGSWSRARENCGIFDNYRQIGQRAYRLRQKQQKRKKALELIPDLFTLPE